jgi:hypothetical protein
LPLVIIFFNVVIEREREREREIESLVECALREETEERVNKGGLQSKAVLGSDSFQKSEPDFKMLFFFFFLQR